MEMFPLAYLYPKGKSVEVTSTSQLLPENLYHPRRPWLAALLSALVPGLGQFYNGQVGKGAAIFIVDVCLIVAAHLPLGNTLVGLVLFMVVHLAWWLFALIDAVLVAMKRQDFMPTKLNAWYYYAAIVVLMFGIRKVVNVKEAIGLQAFAIPTTSNCPTLRTGDQLMANMKLYQKNPIAYGDLVAYLKPSESQYWMGRIIALPGDRVQVIDDTILINGKRLEREQLRTLKDYDGGSIDSTVVDYLETLPNGKKHHIWQLPERRGREQILTVDTMLDGNSYFLMGDNRDNSLDSRYIGPIPKQNIRGKMMYTYWGKTTNRINIDLTDK